MALTDSQKDTITTDVVKSLMKLLDIAEKALSLDADEKGAMRISCLCVALGMEIGGRAGSRAHLAEGIEIMKEELEKTALSVYEVRA